MTSMSVKNLKTFVDQMELTKQQHLIGDPILKEIRARVGFLNEVGLDYLSLSRATGTLSGGEAQRIRLATQIGSGLVGVAYILDEPSIGLHQRDNDKLLGALMNLRDLGNTLIVVEHDEDTMRAADVHCGYRTGSRLTWWTSGCVRHCRRDHAEPGFCHRGISERKNPDPGSKGAQKTDRLSNDQGRKGK